MEMDILVSGAVIATSLLTIGPATDRDEFLVGLISLKIALNREELGLLWTLFDTNGDGKLDYCEFEPIIRKDDASQGVEATGRATDVRKGSQLALRRPSMLKVRKDLECFIKLTA